METNNIPKVTKYLDLLGQEFDDIFDASRSNEHIQLQFRKYIEEECLRTFGDNQYDKLGTTLAIWEALEFTPECIKNICKIMERD